MFSTRRAFLADVGFGFTGLALGALLQRDFARAWAHYRRLRQEFC